MPLLHGKRCNKEPTSSTNCLSSLNGSAQLQSPSPKIASAKAGFFGSLKNPAVSKSEDGTLHSAYVKTCGMSPAERWAPAVSLVVSQHELSLHQG